MRLIDADELKKRFCTHCEGYNECSNIVTEDRECYDFVLINHVPTIEAIPISWMKSYSLTHDNGMLILPVIHMINEWRRYNGQ